MKGQYNGVWTPDQLFQAFSQDWSWFPRNRITHLRGFYIYFTACDAIGRAVTIRDEHGELVKGYETAGHYRSAADTYDADRLTPLTLLYPVPTEH